VCSSPCWILFFFYEEQIIVSHRRRQTVGTVSGMV